MTAPRSRALDKRYFGVAEALVVDVDDPQKEGRIKLRFPWLDDTSVSEWCRVAQVHAGNGRGAFFSPEVGDEVLVAFVHGDMRLPIAIGCLYNGQDKPPTHRQGTSKDQKMIRTRTGHELVLDDTSGAERVRITTQGGHVLDLDDAGKKVSVTTSGGHKVDLDDGGKTVTVEASGGPTIVIKSSGTVDVTAAGAVTVKAASAKLDAPKVELGSAPAMSVLLGEIMMAVFNAHTHNLGPLQTSPPIPPMTGAELSKVVKTS